jgi:nicotinate-nucleotide pyrophosphorylase (carboxylating)
MTAHHLDPDAVRRLIGAALAEDLGNGDITSEAVIPLDLKFRGVMAARQDVVLAGLPLAHEAFRQLVPDLAWRPRAAEGDRVPKGGIIAEVEGNARGLLSAERTALNCVQHLSGIATQTRRYVDAIAGTGATLLDTRKTIPGLRDFAKYAVRVGGGTNHRIGLFDGVLIKDNHLAVCGSLTEAVRLCRAKNLPRLEVECDSLEQVREAVDAGPDMILLDNMDPEMTREAVAIVAGRVQIETSGGVTLETIRAYAEAGVDFISVGRLTQSSPAVDIGLDWH